MSELISHGVTVVGVVLDCPNCGQETRHEVHYVAGLLHRMECEACGHRWDVSHRWLRQRYLLSFPGRVAAKQVKLAREARTRPVAFMRSLPRRTVRKMLHLAGEVGALAGIIDK